MTKYTPQFMRREARAITKGYGKLVHYWIEVHDHATVLVAEYSAKDGLLAHRNEQL